MNQPATRALTKEEFKQFQDYIHKNCGIYIDDFRADALRLSLSIRMKDLHIERYYDYLDLLMKESSGEEEFKELLNLITVNETCFFRNPAQFSALRKHVLPEIISRKMKTDKTIRIWSAGCSTGEEPYSIAMALLDVIKDPESWRIDILGTDVSRQVLVQAQRGCYGKRAMRETDQYYVKRYFHTDTDGSLWLDEKIKNMVNFAYHNLVKDTYPMLIIGGWDIIFCRNVTIYFQVPDVRKVIDNFYKSLNDEGYLLIGHAEMLYKITDILRPIELEKAFVYQKNYGQFARNQDVKRPIETTGKIVPFRKGKERTSEHRPVELVKPDIRDKEFDLGIRKAEEQQFFNEARALFKAEDFVRAEERLGKVLELNPANTEARLLLGQVLANDGRYEQAMNEVQKVRAAEPTSVKAHFLMGVIYQSQELLDEAIREYKRVVYLDREFALAYLNLASIYRIRGMDKDALREYNNAVRSLVAKPHGEWLDFAGGFLAEVLVETCQRNIQHLQKRATGGGR